MKLVDLYNQIKNAFEENASANQDNTAIIFERQIESYDNETTMEIEYGGNPNHPDGPYADADIVKQDITFDISLDDDFYANSVVEDVIKSNGTATLVIGPIDKFNRWMSLKQFLEKIQKMDRNAEVVIDDGKKKIPLSTVGGWLTCNKTNLTLGTSAKEYTYVIAISDQHVSDDPRKDEIEQYIEIHSDDLNEIAVKQYEG